VYSFGCSSPFSERELRISHVSEDILARFPHEFAPKRNEIEVLHVAVGLVDGELHRISYFGELGPVHAVESVHEVATARPYSPSVCLYMKHIRERI